MQSQSALSLLAPAQPRRRGRRRSRLNSSSRPVPGGGTDNFARMIQSIIAKYKLIEQPIVVTNKGGGSGGEGFLYGKTAAGDPHRVIFGTNNEYLLPLVAKMPWKGDDLTPVASLVLDEFILWVPGNSEYKDAKSYIAAVKAKPDTFKMGGSQSKDTDQTLTSMIEADDRHQIPLCAVQERQRSRRAIGRRPYRFQHQQSERKYRPVESRPREAALRVQPGAAREGPESHRRHGLVGYSDLQGSGPSDRAIFAAAHRLAAGRRAGRCRGVLRRRAEKGARAAGMEGLCRAHLANRQIPDGRRVQALHRRTTRRRSARSSRKKAGWLSNRAASGGSRSAKRASPWTSAPMFAHRALAAEIAVAGLDDACGRRGDRQARSISASAGSRGGRSPARFRSMSA